ncbi:MAG: calcium/sodium antiporter [Chlorobi bacterium]|nr:calcium/sodium antiporter [Chlorobiota bacterium]
MSSPSSICMFFPLPDSWGAAGNYIYLILGLIILLGSGEYLVRSGVSLGRRTGISELVIGVTVISIGTSMPELIVSLQAALSGHPDISVGNVVGSNISNISLVLALTILIIPLAVNRISLIKDGPFMIFITLLLILFSTDKLLSRMEGTILLSLVVIYSVWIIHNSRRHERLHPQHRKIPAYSVSVTLLIMVLAGFGLVLGAHWLVSGASGVARSFGVSERVISLSIIALGTSLPELSTSVMAAIRKHADVSVGNIIGSNIFNIGGILGTTAFIVPLKINDRILQFDYWWMFLISGLLLLLASLKLRLTRWKGALLLFLYLLYLVLIFTKKSGV